MRHCDPPKVNHNQGAVVRDENVAVVPILDLQQIAHDAVGCHAADKVAASALKRGAVHIAVHLVKILEQRGVRGTAELVARLGIGDTLNDAAAGRG